MRYAEKGDDFGIRLGQKTQKFIEKSLKDCYTVK